MKPNGAPWLSLASPSVEQTRAPWDAVCIANVLHRFRCGQPRERGFSQGFPSHPLESAHILFQEHSNCLFGAQRGNGAGSPERADLTETPTSTAAY